MLIQIAMLQKSQDTDIHPCIAFLKESKAISKILCTTEYLLIPQFCSKNNKSATEFQITYKNAYDKSIYNKEKLVGTTGRLTKTGNEGSPKMAQLETLSVKLGSLSYGPRTYTVEEDQVPKGNL